MSKPDKLKVKRCEHRPGKYDIIDQNDKLIACFYDKAVADNFVTRYNSHDALVEALETAKGLLNHVNCPQCDGAGAYYDGGGDVCQCQWCYEKGNVEAALAAIKEVE